MIISKKGAYQLGQILALEIHKYKSPQFRGTVLSVRDAVLDGITEWPARQELQKGFNATLDILEPLTLGPRDKERADDAET